VATDDRKQAEGDRRAEQERPSATPHGRTEHEQAR